ncbi:ankyrin repeat-containing domain protein [Xylaria longipes]|nr:ankyrin repeat-containing domain protein [Xylaria longipes]
MAEQPSSNDILTYVTRGDMEGLKECINKGADVHQPIISGKTSLYYAALWGQNEAVRVLLDAGGDVNVKTKTGTTLLHAAVQSKNEATISAVVEYMKTHNISIDPVDDDGETPLCCAARLALPEVVRQLCKAGSNVNGLDPRGRPLVEATYKGGKSTVRVLLDEGADSNLPDGYEQLPIYWAAKAGDLELLELFQKNLITAEPNKISGSSMALSKAIKASREDEILIDVQSTDEEGWTALHLAANVGHSKAIKALVKADSDVNALNRDGLSPLLLAARKGKVASIEALLDNKAVDVNIRDNVYERTALSWAAETGKSRAVELLAEADSDINSLDKSSQTPLVLAAKKGHSDSIKTLLRFGPDMNIKDTIWGQPAVSFAAAGGYAKTTELLAEAGSDINSLDKFGRTPLILAAKGGHSDSIKVLLQFWPNMNIRDVWARSAVSYAAEDFTGKAAEPLIKAGCNIYSQTEDRYPPLEVVARYGIPKLLRLFFEPNSEGTPLPGKSLRVKAIAEALHHACDNDYSETKDIILTEERYLTATDEHGRTVLSWAAEIGSEQAVKVLLHNGVEPDSSDLNNRTPLSWAAESGNLAVVRQLLSQIETSGLIPMKGRQTVNSKSKDKNWTPLWYAALGGHVNVIKTLLEDGANPLVEDNEGRNLMKYLATIETSPASEGLSINTIGRKNVRKILEPFFSLLAQSFPSSEEVDKLFTAMVLQFPMNPDGELRPTLPTVEQLLTLPIHTAQSKNICLKWLHLPANNMRWAEILMTRHYEASGDKGNKNRNQILQPQLWTDNQNNPQLWTDSRDNHQDKTRYHERFMRAGCYMLPLGNGPSQRRTETSMAPDSRHKGFVLFMPYLHWECEKKVLRAKDILKEKGALKHNQDASRKFAAQIMEIGVSDTEKLLWMYVGEDHPLHIRRTLDQYYYPNSENIEARDEDQTTLRYFNDQRLNSKKFDRVLTMVDQL